MLIDGIIWLVPLPGVEILKHQELYVAYDWEYWYRKWRTCDTRLRERILSRYPIATSIPAMANPPTSAELGETQRVSDFWYKHWSWWEPTMRREIKRSFRSTSAHLYQLDALVEQEEDAASDSEQEDAPGGSERHRLEPEDLEISGDERRHQPTEAGRGPRLTPLPAPRMLGPSAAPTTHMLPQSDIDQADRPHSIPLPRARDPNPVRPANQIAPKPLQVWAAEPRAPHKIPTNMFTEVSGKHWKNFCDVMNT